MSEVQKPGRRRSESGAPAAPRQRRGESLTQCVWR
jgi:hypothetical protein